MDKKILVKIFLLGFVIYIMNIYLFQIGFVKGISMYPTLKENNIILIKKFNLNLKYNDIIVIKKDNKIIIKRLVGMPNDSIKIDKYLYVNGKINDNCYIENSGDIHDELVLKDNEYFVLGDNIQNSIDSRFNEIGIIHGNEIIGKVLKNTK